MKFGIPRPEDKQTLEQLEAHLNYNTRFYA